jgi:hypothetical protein
MAQDAVFKTVSVGSLLFDSRNTRIPANRRSVEQRALLHELVQHEEVRELAASIAKLGLFPNERLVVMPEDRRYIVLEGNRRLAAIKLLLSPELAETSSQVKHFRSLSAKASLPELASLEVAVVPDRIVAAPIIAALHTKAAKKRWSSVQQARFYRELVDEGQTAAEVAEQVGQSVGHVNGYLRAETLYSLALRLEYPPAVKVKIADANFPLTTLERFLESKTGRAFLGIELDEQYGFRGRVHPERFNAVLQIVAADVAIEKALTRKINDEKGFADYVSQSEPKVPKTKMRGSFKPRDLLGGSTMLPEQEVGEQPPSKRPPRQSKSVVPTGFLCSSRHDRVRAIFGELKRMDIQQQRNSTGVMLRVLIDIALWSYLKAEGHNTAACDHCDKNGRRRKHNPDWTPSLRDLLRYAVEKHLFRGMTADGYKSIRSLASRDAEYFITIDAFNAFTHNPNVTPTEGDLRTLWQRAEPMLQIILK